MNNQNPSHHQAEIDRLNGIINALLYQNTALAEENARLKVQCEPEHALSSNHNLPDGGNALHTSNEQKVTGKIASLPSGHANSSGRNEMLSSDDDRMIGKKFPSHSNHAERLGGTATLSTNQQSMIGRNEHIKLLPLHLDSGGWTKRGTLAGFLRQHEMRKSKNRGIWNVASILLYLHNKQSGGTRELRRLTELSEGGMAKLIMSLKRKGWIRKEKYGQFALTPGGNYLLLKWYNSDASASRPVPQQPGAHLVAVMG